MGAKYDALKIEYGDLKKFLKSVIAKRDEYYHLIHSVYVASTELRGVKLADLPTAVAAKFKRDRDRINQLENEKGSWEDEIYSRDSEIAELRKRLDACNGAGAKLDRVREVLDGSEGEAAEDGFEDDADWFM